MFDLIIFDCDGTLTDSEDVNNQAVVDVLSDLGLTQYTLEHALKHWAGKGVPEVFLSIQMETGTVLPEDIVVRYIYRVAELQKTALKPVEGAPELVAFAKTKCKICVASNGERKNVVDSLEMTGLLGHFDEGTVFTRNDVKYPKPYPDLFLFAATKMGVEPERCLVIEDSTTGVRAGVAASMAVWGFTGSSHNPVKQQEALLSAGAHAIFPRLIHIKDHLGP